MNCRARSLKQRVGLVLAVSDSEEAGVVVIGEGDHIRPVGVFGIVQTQRDKQFEITVVEVADRNLKTNTLPSTLLHRHRTRIADDATSFRVNQRNGQIEGNILRELVFDIEAERFNTIRQLVGNRPDLQERNTCIQTGRIRIIRIVFLFGFFVAKFS